MTRINIHDTNLTLKDKPTNWGGGVLLYYNQPFTGVVYENYSGTSQVLAESEYKDGILDGRQAEYWENGNIKEECFQKYDYYIGSFKRWNEQGELISHQEFDNMGNHKETIL